MMFLLGMVVAWSAAIVGYTKSRRFVRERLRYVDGVHKSLVPFKVGAVAAVAALPIAWALPIVSGAAAVLFGTAVGWGVAAGRRDIRNRGYLGSS